MQVIGAGVGRTGTYSLKLAVNQLGLGPCHHMEAVLLGISVQVPLWNDVLSGRPDWQAVYSGFESAVDWPTACFFRELGAAYPLAKFVLTTRDPEKWADSFAATIYKLIGDETRLHPTRKRGLKWRLGSSPGQAFRQAWTRKNWPGPTLHTMKRSRQRSRPVGCWCIR